MDVQVLQPMEGILSYVNLDQVWYGIQQVAVTEESDEVDENGNRKRVPVLDDEGKQVMSNHVVVSPEPINNFAVNPNPYGTNPFDMPFPDDPDTEEDEMRGSFNQFMDWYAGSKKESVNLNCIVENQFYRIRFVSDEVAEETVDVLAGAILP